MYQFKILFCCGLFLLSAANTQPLEVLVNTQLEEAAAASSTVVSQTEKAKINWGPVWDDEDLKRRHNEANNDDDGSVDIIKEKLKEQIQQLQQLEIQEKPQLQPRVGAPAASDVCAAPNGLGFRNLLKEAKALLPLDKILKIIKTALASDRQVQGLKRLVISPEYRNRAKSLKKSREFVMLKDYSCKKLNLDLKFYVDFVVSFINLADAQAVAQEEQQSSESSESSSISTSTTAHPGIGGLLQDIRDALPQQKLRELYEHLLASDRYLASGVQRLKSYEYRTLTRNFRRNSDYKQLYQMMEKVGMPMKQLRELINAALGWNNEGEKLNDIGLVGL